MKTPVSLWLTWHKAYGKSLKLLPSDVVFKVSTKLDFSTPDPTSGAYSAPQPSQLDLRGLLLMGGRKEKAREG